MFLMKVDKNSLTDLNKFIHSRVKLSPALCYQHDLMEMLFLNTIL